MIIRYTTLILLLLFCTIGIASLHNADENFDIWQNINTSMTQGYDNLSIIFQPYIEQGEGGTLEDSLVSIVFRVADVTVYIIFTLTIITTKLAIENPQVNFRFLLYLIFAVLIMMFLVPLIKLLIILWVLFSDLYKNRKEKKHLLRLEREKKLQNDINLLKDNIEREDSQNGRL